MSVEKPKGFLDRIKYLSVNLGIFNERMLIESLLLGEAYEYSSVWRVVKLKLYSSGVVTDLFERGLSRKGDDFGGKRGKRR